MSDYSLFGANTAGHHIINLLLHIGAVIFLFLFLNKTTNSIWPAAFAAALFALHPLRVESVAWAAERKDVLSMFFGMATLYSYAFYAENLRLSRYFLCLILFTLSLMAKSMLVTLPFILFLLDYWPLGRWQKALKDIGDPLTGDEISPPVKAYGYLNGRLFWEKIPFFILTIASSILTVLAQYEDHPVHIMPFSLRVPNAIISFIAYLKKMFLPFDLAVFYPFEYSFPLWKILTSCFILICITVVVIYYVKKLPFLFVGWFWYTGTLIPVSGLVPINSPMADRYTYLPSIGIAIMLAWSIPLLIKNEKRRKRIFFPAGIAVLTTLAFITWQQCGYWKNSFTLFNHALQATKNNFLAHNIVGFSLFEKGQTEKAIYHYSKAIIIAANYSDSYRNRGNAYAKLGQYQLAIQDFNKAIQLNPDCAYAYYDRGTLYAKLLGQYKLANEDFNKAISLNSYYAEAYNNRGLSYYSLDQYQLAIADFNKAILLKPDYADAFNNRAIAYWKYGDNVSGCQDAQKACAMGNSKALAMVKDKGLCR